MSHKAAGRDGNLAHMREFALGHAEAAGLFGGGRKLGGHLGSNVRQRKAEKTKGERSRENDRGT